MNKKKILILSIILVIFMGSIAYVAHALPSIPGLPGIPGSLIPFGGRILMIQECLCTGGFALTIGPPEGGKFLYMLGLSRLYKYYQIRPSVWTVGVAQKGGICIPVLKKCEGEIKVDGVIRKMGTSLW